MKYRNSGNRRRFDVLTDTHKSPTGTVRLVSRFPARFLLRHHLVGNARTKAVFESPSFTDVLHSPFIQALWSNSWVGFGEPAAPSGFGSSTPTEGMPLSWRPPWRHGWRPGCCLLVASYPRRRNSPWDIVGCRGAGFTCGSPTFFCGRNRMRMANGEAREPTKAPMHMSKVKHLLWWLKYPPQQGKR